MAKIPNVSRPRSQVTEIGCINPRDVPGTRSTAAKLTGDSPRSVPNLAHNLGPTKSRGALCLLAGFAIVLQLAILVYLGLASYWLKPGNQCQMVSYGYPMPAVRTVLLVIGELICFYVVEKLNMEQTWASRPTQPDLKDSLGPRILWLQRGDYINSEGYSSFCLFGHRACTSMMNSWQRGQLEEDLTFLLLFYSCWWLWFKVNRERPRHSARSKKYLESLVITGTLARAFGCIISFTGLQIMHWLVLTAQLAAAPVMIFLRYPIRLVARNNPPSQYILGGNELAWLATGFGGGPNSFWTSPGNPKWNNNLQQAPDGILDGKSYGKSWERSMVAEAGRDKLASLDESQIENGLNGVFRIHKQLNKLNNRTEPTSKFAMSVARSVEAVMNTIFSQKEYPELKTLSWPVYGHRGSSELGKINLSTKRGEDKRWVACAAEIEAVLLWLSRMKKGEYTVPNSAPLGDGTGDYWLQEKQAVVQQHTMRLLGDNEEYVRQDLRWYLGGGVGIVSEVQMDEPSTPTIEGPASATTNTIEIQTRNIVGSSNSSLEIPPNRQQWARFKTQRIQLYSGSSKTTPNPTNKSSQRERYDHLAVVADSPLELLLAQDLFLGFMWAVSDKMRRLDVEPTLCQSNQIQPKKSEWFDSLGLENTTLSSIAREIERAGLGKLEDAYASIILPLSVKQKLPIPHCLITHARERANYFVTRKIWEGARDVYTNLFRTCSVFGLASPLAIRATATLYEGLREIRALEYLWERSGPTALGGGEVAKVGLGLQRELGTADERVVSYLEIMQKVQRRHITTTSEDTSSADCHQNIKGSGSGKNPCDAGALIGFSPYDKGSLWLTPLHCAVIAGEWVEIECYLAGGTRVNAKDVLGWTPLHYAATQGSQRISKLLLSKPGFAGACLDMKDLAGRTALHQAADNGHEEVVQFLLENGACIGERDNHGSTALHLAAQNGHSDTLRVLLANSAEKEGRDQFGWRPLNCAASGGHLEVVDLLLQKGTDKEPIDQRKQRPLHHAAHNGYRDIVVLLLGGGADREAKNTRGSRPMHYAALGGHLEVIRVLLENGAEADAENRYFQRPLHYAATCGYLDVVQLLLENNANKEAKTIFSQTPLHLAAFMGHLDVVKLLLERGVKTEVEDMFKLTPLHCAAYSGHLEIVRILLDKPTANPNVEDKDGWRPLHHAAGSGASDVVRLLLKSGADIEAKNHDGESAYDTAIRSGHPAVAQLLLNCREDGETRNIKGLKSEASIAAPGT